jgi:hypothetical protein
VKKIITIVLLVFILFESSSLLATSREYKIKGAFLFHFTDFVQWPEKKSSYIIAVIGKDPFDGYLDKLAISMRKKKNKKISIEYYRSFDEVKQLPDIVFISIKQQLEKYQLHRQFKNKPMLTVAEHNNMIDACGVIRIYNKKRKVRLEINVKRAKQNNLKISSKLLRLAKVKGDLCEP